MCSVMSSLCSTIVRFPGFYSHFNRCRANCHVISDAFQNEAALRDFRLETINKAWVHQTTVHPATGARRVLAGARSSCGERQNDMYSYALHFSRKCRGDF